MYIDTNNDSPQLVQWIVDEKDKFSFSYYHFAFRNFLSIEKKSLSSFEDEITVDVKTAKFYVIIITFV